MQRQSESIAALAAALAKAQIELENPEKSLVGSIEVKDQNAPERVFRYASLASGLEIVRKTLSQHDIATVQTTAVDQASGIVNLTTVLAHASGEWIASDWPVCPISETVTPRRMGAALTYARRYALFTLVGIAGEDDLDAPDLLAPSSQRSDACTGSGKGAKHALINGHPATGRSSQASRHNGKHPASAAFNSTLEPYASAQLRDQLISDINNFATNDDAALWAHRHIKEKNSLSADDARCVEESFRSRLAALAIPPPPDITSSAVEMRSEVSAGAGKRPPSQKTRSQSGIDKSVLALPEPRRIREREHVRHVANQSCLVCGRRPCDAHHLRFTQSSALGRKVSDEFTVPLCRGHHRELHNHGDETSWWQKIAIEPVAAARALWLETHPQLVEGKTRLRATTKRASGKNEVHRPERVRRPHSGRSAKKTSRPHRKALALRNEANLAR